MKLKFAILFFAAICCNYSCQKDIVTDVDDFQAKLVINSIFSPDSLWTLTITHSRNILDPNSKVDFVDNADIILADRTSGKNISVSHEGRGVYKSIGYKPERGHTYEIFVNAEGFQQASAVTYVPSKSVLSIKNIEEITIREELVYKIKVDVLNDANERNFYRWELVEGYDNAGNIFHESQLDELNDDLNDNLPSGNTKNSYSSALSADLVQNENTSYEQDFYAVPKNSDISPIDPETGQEVRTKLFLKVHSVSEDLFRFYESLNKYQSSSNINTSISPPPIIFSNVEGGYGIFGSYSETYIKI